METPKLTEYVGEVTDWLDFQQTLLNTQCMSRTVLRVVFLREIRHPQ